MTKTTSILEIGQKAPNFKVKDELGKTISLSDFRGKKNVCLYFYPKDDTPGCTKEACSFRDSYNDLQSKEIVVLGVSPDSGKKHQNFIEKYNLPFSLLVDAEKDVAQKYTVWKEKSMFGKKYMGVQRSTFLIGKDGSIVAIWLKVKPVGHAEEVLKALP